MSLSLLCSFLSVRLMRIRANQLVTRWSQRTKVDPNLKLFVVSHHPSRWCSTSRTMVGWFGRNTKREREREGNTLRPNEGNNFHHLVPLIYSCFLFIPCPNQLMTARDTIYLEYPFSVLESFLCLCQIWSSLSRSTNVSIRKIQIVCTFQFLPMLLCCFPVVESLILHAWAELWWNGTKGQTVKWIKIMMLALGVCWCELAPPSRSVSWIWRYSSD